MKVLIWISFVLWGAFLPAYANEHPAIDPNVLKNRPLFGQLDQIFQQYFERYGLLDPNERPTLEVMKDPLRQKRLYELYRLLGTSIDDGYGLEHMVPLGLKKVEEGHYEISLAEQPRWASLSDLSIWLHGQTLNRWTAEELRVRGFDEQDIDTLRRYIAKASRELTRFQGLLAFIEQQPLSKQSSLQAQNPSFESALMLFRNYMKASHFAKQQWLLNMFEQLEITKQRILLTYLQDKLGSKSIARGGPSYDGIISFAKRLSSGNQSTTILDEIKALKQESEQ